MLLSFSLRSRKYVLLEHLITKNARCRGKNIKSKTAASQCSFIRKHNRDAFLDGSAAQRLSLVSGHVSLMLSQKAAAGQAWDSSHNCRCSSRHFFLMRVRAEWSWGQTTEDRNGDEHVLLSASDSASGEGRLREPLSQVQMPRGEEPSVHRGSVATSKATHACCLHGFLW